MSRTGDRLPCAALSGLFHDPGRDLIPGRGGSCHARSSINDQSMLCLESLDHPAATSFKKALQEASVVRLLGQAILFVVIPKKSFLQDKALEDLRIPGVLAWQLEGKEVR